MTRISACDGRYLSLAQQKRAWEELNRIFGGTTPTPPDPPGPSVVGNSLYYAQGFYIQDLLADPVLERRLTQRQIETSEGPVLVPFLELDGSTCEIVVLFTYIMNSEADPLHEMYLSYGSFIGEEEYRSETSSWITWQSQWPQDFLIVEVFYCDGKGFVYYQSNLDFNEPNDPVQPSLGLDRFEYDPAAGERPGICFYGATAERQGGAEGFIGAMVVSLKIDV